ncbi:terminase [Serratia fonticola]|uniref:terminase n=1 Tax=Serratia fonticola TaxID=47917 RepID=UPI00301C200D
MDIHLLPLHPGQRKVWADGLQHRNNVVRCGRRWGKTAMLVNIAISYVTRKFRIPDTERKIAGIVGIFTPQYRQYQEIFDELVKQLGPLIKSQDRSKEKRIILKNGGKIDFWITDNNKLAGRSRKYHAVLMDESAFTKSPEMLNEAWPKAIKPTLLDYLGRAWVFSTPDGIDDDNFFYALCRDSQHKFYEHHAPTSSNPKMSADELKCIEAESDPRVWQQEYLAEFVDWSETALFDINKLLEDDVPVAMPKICDSVFAVMDTALKGGQKHDGTGVVYFAYQQSRGIERLTIVDWDVVQINAALLEDYLPQVFGRLEELTQECHTRQGSRGLFIEDANTGSILLQKGENAGWPVQGIDSVLTSKGKDERGIMSSGHHYRGKAKITQAAWDKTVVFKKTTANHLTKQISGFHLADPKAATRADDLLDCYMYGLLLAFGDGDVL